jgi:Rrf2 family protein
MVTRAADYALRATLALAGLPPGARLCLADLAGECDVPPAYLYKVLQLLARSGMLAPHRGSSGGYELTARAREASVLDVVEAVNGLPLLNTCVLTGGCHRAPACPAHPVWKQAQDKMREVLAGARIAELARPALARPGRRSWGTSPKRMEDR